jgi:xylan 1,4-beta-xylosidase
VHVIFAKNPRGPWSKPVDLKLPHQWIDPGHVVSPEGKRYLGLSNGYLVPLTEDGLAVVGQPKKIYEGWPVPWDPNRFCGEGQCLEGPKFFRRGDYYYFVSAENGTAGPPTSHMLVVARSKAIEGPWENCPYNPIVHTESSEEPWWSRGHGTIFDTADGRWYVIYHAYKAGFHTLGRFTLIEPIVWREDGWPTVPKSSAASDPELAAPIAPSSDFSDNFSDLQLRDDWQYYGAIRPNLRLGAGLIVQAHGETMGKGMFLTYIPRDTSYSVEADVEISGATARGGLLLFYSPQHYAGLVLEKDGLHFERDNMRFLIKGTQAPRLDLRLDNDRNIITMYFRKGSGDWTRVDFAFDLSGYNHNTFGGFDSLRSALTANGSGKVTFHQFKYLPKSP